MPRALDCPPGPSSYTRQNDNSGVSAKYDVPAIRSNAACVPSSELGLSQSISSMITFQSFVIKEPALLNFVVRNMEIGSALFRVCRKR
jgi:hypothetical protein